MSFRLPSTVHLAMVAASLAVFVADGHFAATAVIEAQQARQLEELTESLCAGPRSLWISELQRWMSLCDEGR
jgi:hypothetical protein